MTDIIKLLPTEIFTAIGAGVVSMLGIFVVSKVKAIPVSLVFGTRKTDIQHITREQLESHCDAIHAKTDTTVNGIYDRQSGLIITVNDIKETLSKRLYEHDTRIAVLENNVSHIRKE